ncbi:hypothetical protein [Pantoea sp.]|uniref:hypothetical protein n=1 Tax=Pantoea sp. TaxID=69393 RepID=UPI0028ADBC79|nr:hypothetical protein [Pantoea sp.]
MNFLKRFSKNYRRITARHNIPYAKLTGAGGHNDISSVVIPTVGADFIEEATLSATFAARFAPALHEIVIVTDQPAKAFTNLPEKARVVTLNIEIPNPDHRYAQLYKSRLLKMQAPLSASPDSTGVLMIDSDLNLLQMPNYKLEKFSLYSCFRGGRMGAKFEKRSYQNVPAYYASSVRPSLEEHVNSAFLAATYFTWQRLCPIWVDLFNDTWTLIPDDQPPTDQPPLAAALDFLDYKTVNLGDWTNWPVSKKIGGTPSFIPKEVIGAHGGFPLTEWQKYLENPLQALLFHGQDYTRKVRYLTDEEKRATASS